MSTKGDLIAHGIEPKDGKSLNLFRDGAEFQIDNNPVASKKIGIAEGTTVQPVKTVTVEVDASAGGTAQETAIASVPENAIIVGVIAQITEAFDGDTTTTLEVGVSGNIDNYIDTSDFDPSGTVGDQACNINGANNDQTSLEFVGEETDIIATWTNTASAEAGKVKVSVSYIEL